MFTAKSTGIFSILTSCGKYWMKIIQRIFVKQYRKGIFSVKILIEEFSQGYFYGNIYP